MNRSDQIDAAIAKAYRLSALLEVSGMALWSESENRTFEKAGGLSVIELAAEMAGDIIDGLELSQKQLNAGGRVVMSMFEISEKYVAKHPASDLAYRLRQQIAVTFCAFENNTSGVKIEERGIGTALEYAEAMASKLVELCEQLENERANADK